MSKVERIIMKMTANRSALCCRWTTSWAPLKQKSNSARGSDVDPFPLSLGLTCTHALSEPHKYSSNESPFELELKPAKVVDTLSSVGKAYAEGDCRRPFLRASWQKEIPNVSRTVARINSPMRTRATLSRCIRGQLDDQ